MREPTTMPEISVVLPTYNERDNIGPLIEAILANLDCPIQIIVVDDDSPDGTWQVVQEIATNDERIQLLRRTNERGLTSALNAGITHAKGDIIAWMDCDLSMPPQKLPELVVALAECDLAVGSRYVKGAKDVGHSFAGQAFSWTINFCTALLLGFAIRDYTSGFIAAKREVFDQITLRGDYGEYCIDLLHRARKKGFKIKEIPYHFVPRKSGESKTATGMWGYFRRGIKYVILVLRLWFTPSKAL
jgi:dolichol-phosphate mannosyltransferase